VLDDNDSSLLEFVKQVQAHQFTIWANSELRQGYCHIEFNNHDWTWGKIEVRWNASGGPDYVAAFYTRAELLAILDALSKRDVS